MSGIRGKDTKPELLLRSGLHRRGFRYRLHYSYLPGKPDMVFPKFHALIMINGCFWHGHNCHLFKWPTTRKTFWKEKILSNQVRDERNLTEYWRNGWRTLVIWECALKGKTRKNPYDVINYAAEWLSSDTLHSEIEGYIS